ncbi:hypothetical protein J6590_063704 [Homalodisca vitripennis]|nr:hypothetical protein J6590_063704 [Homalodisca vitripennis]
MSCEVLPHPPYSPDLSPSDFHLFGLLKEALRGNAFRIMRTSRSRPGFLCPEAQSEQITA